MGPVDVAGLAGDLGNMFNQNAQAAKNRRHQIKMYKNRHQWQVEDLRAAGLNPILSAGGAPGGGAGAMPAGSPQMGSTINTGRKLGMEKKKLKTELEILDNTATKTAFDARTAGHNAEYSRNQWLKSEYALPGLVTQMNIDKSPWGVRAAWANRMLQPIGSAADLLKPFKGLRTPKLTPRTTSSSRTTRNYDGGSQVDTQSWSNR